MAEQDALDILTTASLIHRKLDNAYCYVGGGRRDNVGGPQVSNVGGKKT